MYLRRLEIQGFKSFANRTVLDFLPPKNGRFSLTAVVGPNGSGKSNVADALRWVMGEQSAKMLRGKKSEDVIFSGSENKGQLGLAEVVMILENSDRRVLPDYPEITIARRLYRSGESEYLVNNQPARLLDVHLLLAQAQFAEHSYGIIGQGMIDRMLTVSPAERKEFLDEASGVKEFQIKRHQAELKLNRTAEHLTQAEQLVAEIEPRLKMLQKQVKRLAERQEVELRLREREEEYYATLYSHNATELAVIAEKFKLVSTDFSEKSGMLSQIQTELAELAREASRQDLFNEVQHRYQEVVKTKNELERQLAVVSGRMQTAYTQAGKQNMAWLEQKTGELTAERVSVVEQAAATELAYTNVRTEAERKQAGIATFSLKKTALSVDISRLETQLTTGQSEQNFWQFSGLSAVQAVWEARRRFGGTVHGPVAELGQVSEDYQLALEVSAGAHLSSIVVDSEDTARQGIEYLRNERLGVATFLPLTKIQPRTVDRETADVLHQEGVVGLAIDLVQFAPELFNVFSFLFGNTVVVTDLAAARRIGVGRCRMVTLQGDVAEKNGVMKGGFRAQKKHGLSFSSRLSLVNQDRVGEYEARLAAARSEMAILDHHLEQQRAELAALEVTANDKRTRSELFANEVAKLDQEIAGLNRELALSNMSPEQYGEQVELLSKERVLLEQKLSAADRDAARALAEVERFNAEEETKKQRVFTLQEEMQRTQEVVNQIVKNRSELEVERARIETKQEDVVEEARVALGEAITGIVDRGVIVVPLETLPEVNSEIQKLKYQLSLIGGIDPEVVSEHKATSERYEYLRAQLTDLRAAEKDLTTLIAELDGVMKKKRSAAFKKIRQEFSRYFAILFDGGKADLEEVYGVPVDENAPEGEVGVLGVGGDSEQAMEVKKQEEILTGIEVSVNPPGKKIKNLSALSGGERTLTSIALICAILHYNPSPFVVLDEVEAALDEANTLRFAKIMGELASQSQFVIITHNRATMHAADALYGVVMNGDGISKVMSVKLEEVPVYEA